MILVNRPNKLICTSVAVLVAATVARAGDDDGSDTLRFYLSKSSLVVSGEIVGLLPSLSHRLGAVNYGIGLKVANVLKGDLKELPEPFLPPKNAEDKEAFWVSLSLADIRPLPFVKKGQRVILFLREWVNDAGKKAWQGADPWFAIQPGSDVMEQSILRWSDKTLTREDESGNDTLQHYIYKSSLIVSGRIVGDPLVRTKGKTTYQHCRLRTEKVLMGDSQGDEVEVDIAQPDPKRPMVPLRNNAHVILFLTEADDFVETGGWVSADPWFGSKDYNPVMVQLIERLVKD